MKRCVTLDMARARYRPFRGRRYIKTPAYIPPLTVINVRNQDNRCFEWAILSAMNAVMQNPHRPSKYEGHLGELNFTGIVFPVAAEDAVLNKFEQQNPGLSVSVSGWDDGPHPLYVSKQGGHRSYEIDLLLLADSNDPSKKHYVRIKYLARLCYKDSNNARRKYPCRRCLHVLHVFSSKAVLKGHKKDCGGIGKKPQRIVMPAECENILCFQNRHKQMRVPYIIYADFEALNIPAEGAAMDSNQSNTRLIAEQKSCSFCYTVVR